MKTIFYLTTLELDDITITDKIVYSQILYISLWHGGEETFAKDSGKFKAEELFGTYIPIDKLCKPAVIYDATYISRQQYYDSIERLMRQGYIQDDYGYKTIAVPNDITTNYIELYPQTELKGMPLIVYSYLVNKARKYGQIEQYYSQLAERLNMSESHLTKCIWTINHHGYLIIKKKGRHALLTPLLTRKENNGRQERLSKKRRLRKPLD